MIFIILKQTKELIYYNARTREEDELEALERRRRWRRATRPSAGLDRQQERDHRADGERSGVDIELHGSLRPTVCA